MSVLDNILKKKTLGIRVPVRRTTSDGVFDLTNNTLDKVKSSLYVLIFTGYGERLMMPGFGSPITQTLFEPLNKRSLETFRRKIEESVNLWLPEILLTSVETTTNDTEPNRLNIVLRYSLRSNPAAEDSIVIEMRK